MAADLAPRRSGELAYKKIGQELNLHLRISLRGSTVELPIRCAGIRTLPALRFNPMPESLPGGCYPDATRYAKMPFRFCSPGQTIRRLDAVQSDRRHPFLVFTSKCVSWLNSRVAACHPA